MAFYRQYIAEAPEELGAFFMFQIAPPLPFIPEERHGDTLCGVVTCWSGPERDETLRLAKQALSSTVTLDGTTSAHAG